jgi:hypothetical protein
MRNTLLFLSILCSSCLFAQTPAKFNYQAVARDNAGNPLSNKLISLRISVLNSSPTGTEVYKETFLVSTNEFGHFNLAVGTGIPVTGSFNAINWDVEEKYLKVEMDAIGGTNFVTMGSTQLLSVPYALNARYANSVSPSLKINLDQLNASGAVIGQVIVWNGTKWVPTMSSLLGDNWGSQTVQTANVFSGNGTAANKLNLAQQGATNGQVLQWNGTNWVPATIAAGGNDNWGTQTATTNSSLTGNGTSASPLGIAQQGASSGQVLKWNGTTWAPANETGSDNWGTQKVVAQPTLTGDGTSGNELGLAQQGATNGQVLKWNGTTWIPRNDSLGTDNWGSQKVVAQPTLTGDGTSANELGIAQQGATNGQVLKWNGSTWIPQNDSLGSDNWGTQTANTNSSLTGNGTSTNPLGIAPQGATTGQVLRWNGTAWVPATLSGSGTGDDWGIQSVVNNGSLIGVGTSGSRLGVDSTWIAKKINQSPIKDSITTLVNSLGGTATASNGLAKSGSNITLGGALTTPTSISTSVANTIAFSGLQSGNVGDSIMVSDATTGVVKRISSSRIASASYTSNNGLTQTGTNFALGGTLTAPTSISTSVANTIAFSGLQSGNLGDSLVVSNPTTGILRRISASRISSGSSTYTSNNGISLTGSNFALGGALTAPTSLTTSGTNTLALTGVQAGSINDSILVSDATSGVIKRISATRLPSGSAGSVTASNGLTATGSNVTLGGTITGATVINTTQTNNIALVGLWTGFDDDSILTSNAISGIINRQHRDRVNYWKKDALGNLFNNISKVGIGTNTPRKNLDVVRNAGSVFDTAAIFESITSGAGDPVAILARASNSTFNGSGLGIIANGGFSGVFSEAIGVANMVNLSHFGIIGRARGNNLGTLTGVFGEADSTTILSVGLRGAGSHTGVLGNVKYNDTKSLILGFGFADTLKTAILGAAISTTASNANSQNSNIGAYGIANVANTWANIGVNGLAKAPNGNGSIYTIGVLGEAQGGSGIQIGVLGWLDSVSTGTPYAGYFNGSTRVTGRLIVDDTIVGARGLRISGARSTFNDSVRINSNLFVNGTLSKAAGTFRIDHPQDPENKYLVHSFVESPDMMNVYNGNIVTDKDGYAIVTLPTYFESLNKDFRYQLTVIGTFAQAIVKDKIMENQFRIQTDKPNVEVSWQITGIRKDPYAEKHRIQDVEEKPLSEKGTYLHPELYGQPKEKGTNYSPEVLYPKVAKPKMDKVEGRVTKEIWEEPKLK